MKAKLITIPKGHEKNFTLGNIYRVQSVYTKNNVEWITIWNDDRGLQTIELKHFKITEK